MKKIALLFVAFLFAATCSLQAQKQFVGEIQFKTKMEGTDDPNLTSSIESMTSVTSILGNKSKTVQNFDGMYILTSIWNGDKETSTFLIEINGLGKFYKKTTAEEHKNKLKLSEYSYNYVDEYKTICDYKCQRVDVTITNLEDDSTQEMVLYVTKEIGGGKANGAELPGLDGFPLLTRVALPQYCEECVMASEAIKITPKKIKDVDFLLPDDAKNIDDDPELKEKLGL